MNLDTLEAMLMAQGLILASLEERITQLEKKLEISQEPAGGQEVIRGITGTLYTPQIFKGPVGVPRAEDIHRAAQQRHDPALHDSGEERDILA